MKSQTLTIVAACTPGWGHVNAVAGAITGLRRRGHRIIFMIDESFRGKLSPLGYEEFVYEKSAIEPNVNNNNDNEKTNENTTDKAGEQFAADLMRNGIFGPGSAWQKMQSTVRYLDGPERIRDMRDMDHGMRRAIELFKPHLIVYDGNACLPAIHYSKIAWIRIVSAAPLFYRFDDLDHDRLDDLPPGGSGLPFPDTGTEQIAEVKVRRSLWRRWDDARRPMFYGSKLNDYIESWGYARFERDARSPPSERITVYATPDELNYDAIRRSDWFNLEVFNKNSPNSVDDFRAIIPHEFLPARFGGSYRGKLIYVSMGSLGAIDLRLMRRLVEALGATEHRYIVAKGPRHRELSLAANMWGERFLPQTALLPAVDLVITHGGNNSVTETFAAGKPMIVLPNFVDQFDNAQRLHETGFGLRLDSYRFTDQEMADSIERLLSDDHPCHRRLRQAAERIEREDRHLALAIEIEKLFEPNDNSQ